MTVNLLRLDAETPDSFEFDGETVDRLHLGGDLVFSRVDTPRITSFVVAPDYGVQGATGVINASWTVDGDVSSTVLERRRHGSSDAWTAEGISAQTGTDSDPFPWPASDADIRLTVTNRLNEHDTITKTFYRTLAPSIQDWSYANYRQSAAGFVVTSFDFDLDCLCWPKPVVSVSGSTAGQLHVSQGLVQRTSVANGWDMSLPHSVGGIADPNQVWTVTVTNPVTNESATRTLTLGQ